MKPTFPLNPRLLSLSPYAPLRAAFLCHIVLSGLIAKMQLNGQQRKELCEALCNAFSRSQLEMMLSFQLDIDLEQVAAGNSDLKIIVFRLVRGAETEGRLKELIRAACQEKAGNPQIQAIAHNLIPQTKPIPTQAKRSPRFPETCEFDLTTPMKQAIAHLDDKSGLVGLAVPCVEAKFRSKFCERLKTRLGRQDVSVRDPLKIDYRTSVDQVVRRIKRYETTLSRGRDVICPLEIATSESAMVDALWAQLSDCFKDAALNSRLILFLHGREDAAFPAGVRRIDAPRFDAMDVRDWVYDLARELNWQEQTWKAWKQCMVNYCCKEEGSDVLDVYWVYEHIEFSMKLLQSQVQEQDFLQKLELGP